MGMTSLQQARAGGNRAMIAIAERSLVTNPAVTIRKRATIAAPWEREETINFLKSTAWQASEAKVESRELGWKKAWKLDQTRKEAKKHHERQVDSQLMEMLTREADDAELRRCVDIVAQRKRLNTDLLKIAEIAAATVPSCGNRKMAEIETESKGEPQEVVSLQEIARNLS